MYPHRRGLITISFCRQTRRLIFPFSLLCAYRRDVGGGSRHRVDDRRRRRRWSKLSLSLVRVF